MRKKVEENMIKLEPLGWLCLKAQCSFLATSLLRVSFIDAEERSVWEGSLNDARSNVKQLTES